MTFNAWDRWQHHHHIRHCTCTWQKPRHRPKVSAPLPSHLPVEGRPASCCSTLQSSLQSPHQSVCGPSCCTWKEAYWCPSKEACPVSQVPPPPLKSPPFCQAGPPPLGEGDGHKVTVPPWGGGGTTKTYHFTAATRYRVFRWYAPVGFLNAADLVVVGDMGCIRLKY